MQVENHGETKSKKYPYMMVVGSSEEMVPVLKRVFELESDNNSIRGRTIIETSLSGNIPSSSGSVPIIKQSKGNNITPLSKRQVEILKYVAEGYTNRVIASVLGISGHTVKNHLTSIQDKLEASDRTQAVVLAMRNGWLNMD